MQRQLRSTLVTAIVLAVLAASGTAAASVGRAGVARGPRTADPADMQAAAAVTRTMGLESAVVRAINDLRRNHKLAPLRINRELSDAAASHSTDMARSGYFAHDDQDGRVFWKRIEAQYPSAGSSSWQVGENLVWSAGDLSASSALDMWLNSPPHRENLLNPRWREIGLGGVKALGAPGVYTGYDVTILTADFGYRR
jgi:uncharacterized protein YkwD